MKPRIRSAVAATAVVVAILASPVFYLASQRTFNVWWQSEEKIEAYLRGRTPLGTSAQEVLKWLHTRGITAEVSKGLVPAHSQYPLSTTGGTAYIECTVDSHWFIFQEDVMAWYTFDSSGHLVDIRVDTQTDSL